MDKRFLKEEGPDVFSGNELLLKGALEAGCSLITGYPGSPISELFDAAFANRELLRSLGTLAEMANNEALAVARLNGARMAGARALAAMKSVGLHVAADGLALGNLAEPDNEGGCVVVVGDDPWIESTQINNDSRYLSQHLHMPILEPSTFQEIKDWVGEAFALSSKANLYVTYLVTTPQADGGGTVWVHANQRPRINTDNALTLDSRQINLDKNVLLPPRTWIRETTLPLRFDVLWRAAREQRLNTVEKGLDPAMGFIAAGVSYTYLMQALRERGDAGRFPILKLGLTYPLDPEAILKFSESVNALCVVEEKRGFLETQAAEILRAARQTGRLTRDIPLWGKQFPDGQPGFPVERGLNTTVVMEKLCALLETPSPDCKAGEGWDEGKAVPSPQPSPTFGGRGSMLIELAGFARPHADVLSGLSTSRFVLGIFGHSTRLPRCGLHAPCSSP